MTESEEKYTMSEKDRKKMAPVLKVFIKSINNTLDRHDKIRDPMARNMLILDKVCTSIDFLSGMAETLPTELGFDRDLCNDMTKASKRLKSVIDSLFDWIQHPTYTVEHPVGKTMMENGQATLDTLNTLGALNTLNA